MPMPLSQEHVSGAELFANRYEMIRSLSDRKIKSIAEMGVAYGDFSEFMIRTLNPRLFAGYDIFVYHTIDDVWSSSPQERLQGLTHIEYYKNRMTETFGNDLKLLAYEGDAAENLLKYNRTFDLIYIDANHKLANVKEDTRAAIAKLSPGGLLGFNDYILYDHLGKERYGVVDVVNNLCVNEGWRITHFALQEQMFCDVILQKR
jgi:hypothetical protein